MAVQRIQDSALLLLGAQVQSLVGKLKAHKLCDAAKKKKKLIFVPKHTDRYIHLQITYLLDCINYFKNFHHRSINNIREREQ